MTIVLLGDIAAGKGTQARFLARRFNLKHIDTGAYSRKLWSGRSHLGRRMRRVKKGFLAPSRIIQNYLRDSLSRIPKTEGLLLDGGKMPAEARLINQIFVREKRKFLVVYLFIPRREILRRLQSRGRPDDDPQALKNRIRYYEAVYKKTVKYWQSKKKLKKVSGLGNVSQVSRRLLKVIHNFFEH